MSGFEAAVWWLGAQSLDNTFDKSITKSMSLTNSFHHLLALSLSLSYSFWLSHVCSVFNVKAAVVIVVVAQLKV